MSVNYEVPDGWHRLAVSDDEEDPQFDPWFNFIQEIALRFTLHWVRKDKKELWGLFVCFSVDDNFDQYDAGLVTFIKAGPGEEWRLVQVEEEEMDTWMPESGWQVMLYLHNVDCRYWWCVDSGPVT